MLRLAAVNAFDVMVLCSGDADLTPAVEGVRALGKQAYVATWAESGLSKRIRKAAFDHVDLCDGRAEFCETPVRTLPLAPSTEPSAKTALSSPGVGTSLGTENAPRPAHSAEDAFLLELDRAGAYFTAKGGFLGASHFVTSWRSEVLDASADVRRRLLQTLIERGTVETYEAKPGVKALRRRDPS